MDTIKNAFSGASSNSNKNTNPTSTTDKSNSSSSSSSSWGDKINSAFGGGKSSEAKEDYLDKGVDMFQERVMGQGPQNNESAIEQAKDEQISDFIRGQYKGTMGKEFPVQDK